LIKKMDVVTMKVPFPSISSKLAVMAHMYVCLEEGINKEFVKCQTFKPIHLLANKPPFRYIVESPDITRNPFQKKTTIDCDKAFCVTNVEISPDLLTKTRRNVCSELFTEITNKIKHSAFKKEILNTTELLRLNDKMRTPVKL
jgi:uncharacterized protein (UPF0210 family)